MRYITVDLMIIVVDLKGSNIVDYKYKLKRIYESAIEELKEEKSNEHIWEMSCADDYNPHTKNLFEVEMCLGKLYQHMMEDCKGCDEF